MPLETQILRKGKELPLRWGGFHMVAMTLAAAMDGGDVDGDEGQLYRLLRDKEPTIFEADPIVLGPGDVHALSGYHIVGATPLNKGDYTMKETMRFEDPTDGEVLELRQGDVLRMWRSW